MIGYSRVWDGLAVVLFALRLLLHVLQVPLVVSTAWLPGHAHDIRAWYLRRLPTPIHWWSLALLACGVYAQLPFELWALKQMCSGRREVRGGRVYLIHSLTSVGLLVLAQPWYLVDVALVLALRLHYRRHFTV